MLVVLASVLIFLLGVIGVVIGQVPLLRVRGRGKALLVVLGSLVLAGVGGALFPTTKVTVTATPANSTIVLDGKTYTGTTGALVLTEDSYEVKVSAPGHHPAKQTLEINKQKSLQIALKPFTAEEKALIAKRAAAERQRKAVAEASRRQAEEAERRRQETQAAAAAEQQRKEAAAAAERQRQEEAARAEQERLSRLASEPVPAEAEISVQHSSDNMGIEPYFILTDGDDREVAVTGQARLVLTVSDYDFELGETEQTVYDESWEVTSDDYQDGTRGLGAFQRDARFHRLDKISTENLSSKHGNAYLTFTTSQGHVVKAKDSVFYP